MTEAGFRTLVLIQTVNSVVVGIGILINSALLTRFRKSMDEGFDRLNRGIGKRPLETRELGEDRETPKS